jgi:hypothetical protein
MGAWIPGSGSTPKCHGSGTLVNSNPTASQQNMKNFPVSNFFSLIADVVDTGDYYLLSKISAS